MRKKKLKELSKGRINHVSDVIVFNQLDKKLILSHPQNSLTETHVTHACIYVLEQSYLHKM